MFESVKHGDWFVEQNGNTYVVPKPDQAANLDVLGPETPMKQEILRHYEASDFHAVNVLAVAQYLGLQYVPGHSRDMRAITPFLCNV